MSKKILNYSNHYWRSWRSPACSQNFANNAITRLESRSNSGQLVRSGATVSGVTVAAVSGITVAAGVTPVATVRSSAGVSSPVAT